MIRKLSESCTCQKVLAKSLLEKEALLQKHVLRIITSLNSYSIPAAAAAKSLQSCLTLCDPIDYSLTGFSVHGILQARTLEWVAISFSNA